MKSKTINLILPIIIVIFMCITCIYTNQISSSIRGSIMVCLNSIIPSIYGFMIVSDLLVRTNSHKAIGKVLSPISRYVFHLDGNLFTILLISLVAGYPVGAKMISSLENENSIDTHIARIMYGYCYSGGLAFILGTIGSHSSNGLKVSLIVYTSNVIANLILAIILNFKLKIPKKDSSKITLKFSSNSLIDSIESSFRVMMTICVMIVSFSIVISLMDTLQISGIISKGLSKVLGISSDSAHSILNAILEISNTANVSILGKYYIPTLAMIFSFGGVCVITQIVSISGKSFNLRYFLKCRLFTSIVSFILCDCMCKSLLNDNVTVGYVYQTKVSESNSIIPSICLMCMSFILLSKNTRHFHEKVI